MKRMFELEAGMDTCVTIEVDLDVLTVEMATQIYSFWSGGDEVLDVSDNDPIVAAARYAASELLRLLLRGESEESAIDELCKEEGWPPKEQLGMRITDYDLPDFDPYTLQLREFEATGDQA